MQRARKQTLTIAELDEVIGQKSSRLFLEELDVGGRSLLNRNSDGAFRFSHYTIQEFLVAHALATDRLAKDAGPVRASTMIVEFLRDPDTRSMPWDQLTLLDLRGLPPDERTGLSFCDRLSDGTNGPDMMVIPEGRFVMGSPVGESGRYRNEGPQHAVVISRPFALSRYPVTFSEYARFCAAKNRQPPSQQGQWTEEEAAVGQEALRTFSVEPPADDIDLSRPVINVSWEDAVAYTVWISEETGQSYRLPTEAEWEYAARAGTSTRFWWGDHILQGQKAWANCYNCGSTWDRRLAPVGSFEPNVWGLHDMLGNVSEWVHDCWHGNYQGAPADGSTWGGQCMDDYRVVRSGFFGSEPQSLRAAFRLQSISDHRSGGLGFRLARHL
jgi:formylglycine-generating enzyme required for sulfatase activity